MTKSSNTMLTVLNHAAVCPVYFFFNDATTTEIYTLSLHDALPISVVADAAGFRVYNDRESLFARLVHQNPGEFRRSEEHTSELQSRRDLVCRLLLEKKKKFARLRLGRGVRVQRCERVEGNRSGTRV